MMNKFSYVAENKINLHRSIAFYTPTNRERDHRNILILNNLKEYKILRNKARRGSKGHLLRNHPASILGWKPFHSKHKLNSFLFVIKSLFLKNWLCSTLTLTVKGSAMPVPRKAVTPSAQKVLMTTCCYDHLVTTSLSLPSYHLIMSTALFVTEHLTNLSLLKRRLLWATCYGLFSFCNSRHLPVKYSI